MNGRGEKRLLVRVIERFESRGSGLTNRGSIVFSDGLEYNK